MMVYVNGQDIARLVLGVLAPDGSWEHAPELFSVSPEQYLQQFDAYLEKMKMTRADIKVFVLVSGPGSATALRASHALVNALAFVLNVSVASVHKPTELADVDVDVRSVLEHQRPFALPAYAQDPHITQTTRDALKRKTTS